MPTTITVSFLSHLATITGQRMLAVKIDGPPTIATLLDTLKSTLGQAFTSYFFAKDGEFSEAVVMLVNGLNLKQFATDPASPLSKTLSESDEITFIVPFGGG